MLIVITTTEGFVLVSKVECGRNAGVKGKIVEILIEIGIGDIQEVLTRTLPRVGDTNNDTNDANIDEVTTAKRSKRRVGIKTRNF